MQKRISNEDLNKAKNPKKPKKKEVIFMNKESRQMFYGIVCFLGAFWLLNSTTNLGIIISVFISFIAGYLGYTLAGEGL